MEREINIKTKKVNSYSEIIVDNTSDCFKSIFISQHFDNEENPIKVEIQMDVLNKKFEINGISLNETEISIFKEFIDQLKLNVL